MIKLFTFRTPFSMMMVIEFKPSLVWLAYKTLASANPSKTTMFYFVSSWMSSHSKSRLRPVLALI